MAKEARPAKETKPAKEPGSAGLNLLSATQAAEALARGKTTSVALVEDCLARIAARDPDIRAWSFIDREIALAQARARDREPRRSPLHGVPIGIKDIFDTFDMPTAYGSPIYKGYRPAADTAIVGLLRRAGLVILGKCATTEFASPVPIGVKNPRDFGRSPGVSSSGSAAAVADYMVPLSVGSQTGGSTILPAAFCGIFGFKASLMGIDRGGIRHLRPGLDTLGLFARELRDIATLRAVVTGTHPATPPAGLKGLRIGFCRTLNWHQALAESADAVEQAAKILGDSGAAVSTVDMPDVFVGIEDSFRVISSVEGSRALAVEARDHFDALNHWVQGAQKIARQIDQTQFDKAELHIIACMNAMSEIFRTCDVLLTPSTSGEAPTDLTGISNSAFNRIWTVLQTPCVTIPAFQGPNAMPVGVQIVGPVGSDDRTIAFAQTIAETLM
jgi:Asp-tRNA(Asn)/Glu-tRNA(Gln) amidotransferase A subunit family amidase